MKVILKKTIADKLDELIEEHGKDNIEFVEMTMDELNELHCHSGSLFVDQPSSCDNSLDFFYDGIKIEIID